MLDPRTWVVLIAIAVLCAFGGYMYGRSDGVEVTEAKWKSETAKAEKLMHDKDTAAVNAIHEISSKLDEEQENAFKVAQQRDAAVRRGAVKLYIPIVGAPAPVDTATSGEHKEARAQLDPEAAIRIFRITDEGDEAIRQLNSCIDAYERVRNTYVTSRIQ